MTPTQNLLAENHAETGRTAERDQPPLPRRQRSRLVTVGAGIGLVVVWLALGALLELGFVGTC